MIFLHMKVHCSGWSIWLLKSSMARNEPCVGVLCDNARQPNHAWSSYQILTQVPFCERVRLFHGLLVFSSREYYAYNTTHTKHAFTM